MKELLGEVVESIELSSSNKLLRIETLTNTYHYRCAGDCCNDVWLNDIVGVEALLGHYSPILGIKLRPTEKIGEGEDGVLETLGYTLETEGGRCDFILRNDHNGYYGGTMELLTKENFERILAMPHNEGLTFREITEDIG